MRSRIQASSNRRGESTEPRDSTIAHLSFQDADGEDAKAEEDSPTGMSVGPQSTVVAPTEEDVMFGQAYEIQGSAKFNIVNLVTCGQVAMNMSTNVYL